MDDRHRKEVLGEVLADELKAIHEYVQEIPAIRIKVDHIDERLKIVEIDVKAIKSVARLHNQDIQYLKENTSIK